MKASAGAYSLYGLRVHSEIALPAPIAQNALPPYDLQIQLDGRKAMPDGAPAGQLVARLNVGDTCVYTLTDTGDGYVLRFRRVGEFWIARDLRTVRTHLFTGVHPDMAALVLVGCLISCILILAGESPLHASAVEIGGAVLAFLGGPGMGKSSLAALLCAEGARLVTDDLLRLQPDGDGFRCFPGTAQIRLHNDVAPLAENFAATALGTTPDGRIAVGVNDNQSMPRLGAIVIPHLSRDTARLKLQRLSRSKALLHLMSYARVPDLQRKEHLQRRLGLFGRIAASVPVFKADIPWGLPIPRRLATSLIRCVAFVPSAPNKGETNSKSETRSTKQTVRQIRNPKSETRNRFK